MPFPLCKHQICFTSGQLLPTVLAASLPEAEASWIHSLVTPEMKERSRILREVLENRRHRYLEYDLRDTSQQGIWDLLEKVHKQCQGQSLCLNLTGGTKLMALAAAEWADASVVPTFYIDTEKDTILLLGKQWKSLPLPDVLDVPGLLAANGYHVDSCIQAPVPKERRELLREMLQLLCTAPDGARALRDLNGRALAAQESKERIVRETASDTDTWRKLLEICQRAGMLQQGQGYLCFPTEEARTWCNGAWFEELVQMTLYKMQADKKIRSWASAVQVVKENVSNELDALFSVRNRLFMIECKTAEMQKDNKVTPMMYKIDSLHPRLGGLLAQGMICSVLPLSPSERKRANETNIRVVSGKNLLKLDEELGRWISC